MSRIVSVDVFRAFAIVAVIVIHTQPFAGNTEELSVGFMSLSIIIDQIARFAVPFFFVISGYFWGTKNCDGVFLVSMSARMGRKIAVLFLVWSAVYTFSFNLDLIAEYGFIGPIKIGYWNLMRLIGNPVTFAMEGTRVHLWFLMGLLCSLLISAPLVKYKRIKTLFVVSIILYVLGLLAKAYADTPIGININFNTRNGPFFGTIFFVSGYYLSTLNATPKWLVIGVLILVIGYFIHFLELYFLWSWYGINLRQDFVVGTYFVGVGAAIAALSNHRILKVNFLSSIGKLTLGIYLIHYIFIEMLRPIEKLFSTSIVWAIGYVILVLVLSVASVTALSKNKVTSKFVI